MTVDSAHWLVVHVMSPSEELKSVLSEGLVASGATAVVDDAGVLTTWLPTPVDPGTAVHELRRRLEASIGQPLDVRTEIRKAEDWLSKWRDGLGPRRVGRRLILTPSWAKPEDASTDDIVIVIDPQMAFGTGEHASTRGVLRLLEGVEPGGATVLDAGTGSGVLAIACVRLGAARVLAVDTDQAALVNARANIEENGCADSITVEHANVDAAWLNRPGRTFDIIVANVLSEVLRPLLPAFRRSLDPGGALVLGGFTEDESAGIVAAAAAASLRLDREDREEGWWSGRFEAVAGDVSPS